MLGTLWQPAPSDLGFVTEKRYFALHIPICSHGGENMRVGAE
jgi:hypothetical protein